ncbi:MAG TPA: hypothetical protein VGE41_06535, partial [Verrucomicrobiae bacterium]
ITPIDSSHSDIAWPLAATGYNLKSKPNLDPQTPWTAVSDLDTPSNNFHHVTVNTSIGQRFYHLEKP